MVMNKKHDDILENMCTKRGNYLIEMYLVRAIWQLHMNNTNTLLA